MALYTIVTVHNCTAAECTPEIHCSNIHMPMPVLKPYYLDP